MYMIPERLVGNLSNRHPQPSQDAITFLELPTTNKNQIKKCLTSSEPQVCPAKSSHMKLFGKDLIGKNWA